jgi:hypothetical protein
MRPTSTYTFQKLWGNYVKDTYLGNTHKSTEDQLIRKYVPVPLRNHLNALIPKYYQHKTCAEMEHLAGVANAVVALLIKERLFHKDKFDTDWFIRELEQLLAQIVHDVTHTH